MASVFRVKNKKTGGPYPLWRMAYKDYQGVRRVATGTTSEKTTRQLAESIELEHREIRLGLRPKPAAVPENFAFPMVLEEYLAWGKRMGGRKGRPWGHTTYRNKASRLRVWEERLGLRSMGDLMGALARVEKVLRDLKPGRSDKTVAEYGDALVWFCAWAVERDYLPENPLKKLVRGNTEPETIRRALTPEEVERLLAVAPEERAMLYRVALITGLRANELACLTPGHLDPVNQGLILDPSWTKNRRPDYVALPEALYRQLRELVRNKGRAEPLLHVPSHTARELDKDLGAAKVPKATAEGKVDFHALRTTYITQVYEAGATPVEAKSLSRHSTVDLSLTVYARARKERLRDITERVAENIGIGG